MKSIVLSIISLLICFNCYASPGILRHPGGDFDIVVYMGQIPLGEGRANIYTTQRSIDILLNATYYNEKDWGLYILVEPFGVARQKLIDGLKDAGVSWLNTASGSRIFWAMRNPIQTKDNMMTVHPQEDYFNDHGELMGARDVGGADVVNLKDGSDVQMVELNRIVLNYLNREFARRKNMDTGQPIK